MDVVALVSVISSATVGLAGVGAAVWSGSAERKTRTTEATADREHQRRLARDERLFESRKELYGQVAELVDRSFQFAVEYAPEPLAGLPNEQALAVLDALNSDSLLEDFGGLRARVATYGSEEALAALADFESAFRFHLHATSNFVRTDQESSPYAQRALEGAMEAYSNLRAAGPAVEAAMRNDLAG